MLSFDFVATFFSIIFGIALTHIMSAAGALFHQKSRDVVRFTYGAFLSLTIILNWWVAFAWRDFADWTFDKFLVLVLWTMSFFGAAIALFPPGEQAASDSDRPVRNFLKLFLVLLALDTAATAMRTGLFSPWYYLIFVGHYALLAVLALVIRNRPFQLGASFWFLGSLLLWSLVVRRLLV